MAKLPDDLVDPAPPPLATSPSGPPSDLIDPAGASSGGGDGDDGGATQAFQYGMVSGVPFGKTLGAAAETAESYLPKWMRAPGDAPVDQTGEGWAQRYAENRARIFQNAKNLQEAHPYATIAGEALPMLAAPEAGTVKGAMSYGAASGFGEGVEEGDSYAGIAAKTGLGAAGGGLGAAAINKVVPVFGDATRKAVLEAAQRLNTTMPRFAASTSPLVKRAGMIGFSVPGMSTPIEEATHASVSGMGTAAEQAAAGATKQTAGEAASTKLKDWIGPTSQGEVDAYYNRANAAMNQSAQTPLYTTQSIANQIAQRRQAAGISGTGGAVDHVMDAIQRPGGLTYNGIKDLRSSVGEMMNQSILPQGMSGAELKQIYSGLSTDLDRAAYTAGGQRGLQLHNAANDFAKQTADRRNQLSALLGGPKAGASDEAVFQALKTAAGKTGGADIDLLTEARKAITPQSWDHVARGMVSTLGRDADGNFSPQRFITDYGKIDDKAKGVLFGQTPGLQQNLDDLHTVSSQWKSLYKYANPSGTAGHGAGIGMAIEGWRHPLKTLGLYLGGAGLGKLLATPAGAGSAGNFVSAAATGRLNLIRQAAARISATAGAQFGARVDPMALAALAMERPWEGEGGEHGAGDTGGGGQPQ
jgi:hypothetical protein